MYWLTRKSLRSHAPTAATIIGWWSVSTFPVWNTRTAPQLCHTLHWKQLRLQDCKRIARSCQHNNNPQSLCPPEHGAEEKVYNQNVQVSWQIVFFNIYNEAKGELINKNHALFYYHLRDLFFMVNIEVGEPLSQEVRKKGREKLLPLVQMTFDVISFCVIS